ncbi:ATP-grasp domain-containing protein [uncultured Fusobacterium sp.]|uniref:ATP-grasp domain-containing protein n=1 Tax=uncultured Fusobacterium sp. TaxID=159267 RepID=UPI0025993EFA|nr:ATP-grasp domain-containing protein [uncultured Fusobacterium sp.]
MREINILFSSVGRRVELVKYFDKARKKMGVNGTLIGIDTEQTAPALSFVDKWFIVPKVLEKNFIDKVIEICKAEKISLIIPTIDTELLIYSKNKERLRKECGTEVMVSDENSIRIMRDKILTMKVLKENGINVPNTLSDEDIESENYDFPLFIKPLNGSSSFDNFKINNKKELNFFKEYVPNPMIQEFIPGQEYCVDVFSDFESNVITVVPKKRVAFREGEITKGLIEKDKELIETGKKLVEILKPVGEINFDCIKVKNKVVVLEVNGRFAGGSPMSFEAGANSPENLYKIFLGEKLEYTENYCDGMWGLRFDDCIFKKNEELK